MISRRSYVVLRGQLCDTIVLNAHKLTGDKCEGTNYRFHEAQWRAYVINSVSKT